jgi:hypothetical protein
MVRTHSALVCAALMLWSCVASAYGACQVAAAPAAPVSWWSAAGHRQAPPVARTTISSTSPPTAVSAGPSHATPTSSMLQASHSNRRRAWPGCVMRIDPQGRPSIRFANAGSVEWLCLQKDDRIAVSGENNAYESACAAVLGVHDPPSSSAPGGRPSRRFANGPAGTVRDYVLFPTTEMLIAEDAPYGLRSASPASTQVVLWWRSGLRLVAVPNSSTSSPPPSPPPACDAQRKLPPDPQPPPARRKTSPLLGRLPRTAQTPHPPSLETGHRLAR